MYHNYVDKISDWKDILEDIYHISSYKMKELNGELKDFLLGSVMYKFLCNIDSAVIEELSQVAIINEREKMKPKSNRLNTLNFNMNTLIIQFNYEITIQEGS